MKKLSHLKPAIFFAVILFYSCNCPTCPTCPPAPVAVCPGLPVESIVDAKHVQFINTSSTPQRFLVYTQADEVHVSPIGVVFEPLLGDFILQPCSFAIKDYSRVGTIPTTDVRVYVYCGPTPLTGTIAPANMTLHGVDLGRTITVSNTTVTTGPR